MCLEATASPFSRSGMDHSRRLGSGDRTSRLKAGESCDQLPGLLGGLFLGEMPCIGDHPLIDMGHTGLLEATHVGVDVAGLVLTTQVEHGGAGRWARGGLPVVGGVLVQGAVPAEAGRQRAVAGVGLGVGGPRLAADAPLVVGEPVEEVAE